MSTSQHTADLAVADAYYVRQETTPADPTDPTAATRSVFAPTIHTQGAWRVDEQHMAPVSGVVASELLNHRRREDLRVARVNFEILGTLHLEPFEVVTTTIRPGRTIELVESVMISRGRPCLIGRAWRLVTSDTAEHALVNDPVMAGPEQATDFEELNSWPGGYIESIAASVLPDHAPGHGRAWLTNPFSMIEGEETEPLIKLIGMVDTANGVAPPLATGPGGHFFANVDLQIHLHRAPEGDHLGFQTTSNVGPDGVGLTSAILSDVHGPFGRSEQIQTVRAVPAQP